MKIGEASFEKSSFIKNDNSFNLKALKGANLIDPVNSCSKILSHNDVLKVSFGNFCPVFDYALFIIQFVTKFVRVREC